MRVRRLLTKASRRPPRLPLRLQSTRSGSCGSSPAPLPLPLFLYDLLSFYCSSGVDDLSLAHSQYTSENMFGFGNLMTNL